MTLSKTSSVYLRRKGDVNEHGVQDSFSARENIPVDKEGLTQTNAAVRPSGK